MLPKALKDVIEALGRLPGVGPRTAERYGYYLLKADPSVTENLACTLSSLHSSVKSCPITFALIDGDEEASAFYADETRDRSMVLVVEEPLDILAVERTRGYNGTYHVLGGAISPLDGITPDKLHIDDLIKRVERDKVKEIIIATNASVEGESTAIYLQKQIKDNYNDSVKISRLARGIPIGVDLEYADQITLSHALNGRTTI